MLLFLGYAAALMLIVVGFSLGTSVLFLRYRDLNQVWDLMVQAGFFLAPIIYPLTILPERFHIYLYLWPPTSVIEFARAVLVARTVPTMTAHLLSGRRCCAEPGRWHAHLSPVRSTGG